MTLKHVLYEVADERARQDVKWGQQDHPMVTHTDVTSCTPDKAYYFPNYALGLESEEDAKERCEANFKAGNGTWFHILAEEVSEACCAKTEEDMRAELVQVAAVAVAMVEALDRRQRDDETYAEYLIRRDAGKPKTSENPFRISPTEEFYGPGAHLGRPRVGGE